jgi:hypothetical protein
MLEIVAAGRQISRLTTALACLAVVTVAACGSQAGAPPASRATARPAGSLPATATSKQSDVLNGVSCASAANCTAVGEYDPTASGPQPTLIERWNGSAWLAESSPSTPGGSLDSVSCPAATSCTAVGSLILGWNGVTWKVELASSPFVSVSCGTPTSCVAVGVTSGGVPESGYWNGTDWTRAPMPRPRHPAQSIALAGVSCAGRNFCMAVGDYSYGVGAMPSPAARDRTLAELWNGSSWRVIRSADVAHWDQLSAVSCTSPRACTAVGSSASQQFALAERWDGSTWTTQRVPDVNRIGYTRLTAVSCSSGSACMALGTYNGGSMAIAELWNGATWELRPMPGPPQPEPFVQPGGLSCASPVACVAVGTDGSTLAEIWAGAHWQITPAPSP